MNEPPQIAEITERLQGRIDALGRASVKSPSKAMDDLAYTMMLAKAEIEKLRTAIADHEKRMDIAMTMETGIDRGAAIGKAVRDLLEVAR